MKIIEFFRSFIGRIPIRLGKQNVSQKSNLQWNHLPDLCLIAIFTRLPQADLITVRRVCTRWKSLVLVVNNKITILTITINDYPWQSDGMWQRFVHHHTELLVQNNDEPVPYFRFDNKKDTKWNSLLFKCTHFDLNLVEQITNTFPAITSLELSHYGMSTNAFEPLNQLLTHYHSQLISIKLVCESNRSFDDEIVLQSNQQFDCSPLFVNINRMPSPLRTLLVELGDFRDDMCLKNPEPLPIISQLEQFYLNSSYLSKKQMACIKKAILANPNLRQIGIRFYGPFSSPDEKDFRSRITHVIEPKFVRGPDYMDGPQLSGYCNQFISVTNVSVELDVCEFLSILKQLSKLRQLMYLQLKIEFPYYYFDPEDEKLIVQSLIQLPSVKIIKFEMRDIKSASNFATLNIPYHFPQVEVIEIKFCGRADVLPSKADEIAIYEILKQCSRLHHINHL